ncbi:MAG: DUF397 domain-containing protein [Pseudonocardiaceae bacterium]
MVPASRSRPRPTVSWSATPKDRDGPALTFPPATWHAFLTTVTP